MFNHNLVLSDINFKRENFIKIEKNTYLFLLTSIIIISMVSTNITFLII